MKKFRLYFDKDKEEAWLNEMCREGWAMVDFFAGLYVFVPCEPGEYTYRVDMPEDVRSTPIWKKNREYINLVEETGAEYVCKWGWWLIFRKETAKGEFELYTDIESQVALYRRIRRMFLIVGLLECSLALQNTGNILHLWSGRDILDTLSGLDVFVFVCVVIMYSIIAAFFFVSWKLTRKIRRLRQ